MRSAKPGIPVTLIRLCIATSLWLFQAVYASQSDTIRIGVLAFRDIQATEQQWSALGTYLTETVGGHRFTVVPLYMDDLSAAAAAGKVDFVLTQPEQYVLLRARHGLAAVATLTTQAGGQPVSRFGGVIFTRADKTDINRLADLRGKVVAAAHQNSFGSYRIQQWTLMQAGLNIPDDLKRPIFTGPPQDQVIEMVLNGQADAGFIRTGLIEALASEGRLDPGRLKLINPQQVKGFPLLLSTALFPEWPFSAAHDVPEALIKAVTLALLKIPPDHPAATNGKFYGFSPPADYSGLESVMLALRAHPDRLEHFDTRDIVDKYSTQLVGGLSVLLIASMLSLLHLIRSKRQVGVALRERASLLDSLGDGVYGIDQNGRCTFINPKALEMLGWTANEIIGADQHALFHHHRPDGSIYPLADCPVHQTLSDGQRRQGEEWFITKDGRGFPVQYSATPISRQIGKEGAVVTFRDISEARKADELMRIAAIAFETQEAMVVTDAKSRILRINRAFTEVTGYTAAEAIGQTPALLKSGYHEDSFYKDLWASLKEHGLWRGEIWNRRKNGEIYPEWLTISAVRGQHGEITHFVSSFLDITKRKEAEEQIQFLALYDPLTHLPNRRLLNERLSKALASSGRLRRHAALLFIDLDNFKMINDSMGHDIGDLLLRQVGLRLRESVRSNDTVARLGGDEFVILLEELSSNIHDAITQIEHIAQKMLDSLVQPYKFVEFSHHCTASIGAIPFMGTDETIESLLKSADMAMYKAKAAGKNRLFFFDPAMQTEIEARATLERDLRQALLEKQFVLYLQPQVDQSGHIFGAEALIRWQHPTRGLISPGEFTQVAEETRLILPIGQWVLEEACKQLVIWQGNPQMAHLTLAINVSALQFRNHDFVDDIARAIRESGAPASLLKLEITESLLLEDIDGTIERMQVLKNQLGIGLSLDDFGTGYSSLSYLKQLPLDQIKIDRSFVQDIHCNPNDAAIAEAVIALGRTFSLNVIAEGVETVAQRDALIDRGCLAFQGFLFGRPGPIDAFPEGNLPQRNSQ
ncbi:MAG: diguanylate cyclase/phosphodiesterase with sensor(s) [Proteobacteria bacterium]|nr:diguanylate cyclase/phosphodiesterase with sensor(s) [Pseudomonadota bacterium]